MTQAPGTRKTHILVIEDNPADVDLLRRALSAAGIDYELTVVDDGAEAMALVRQSSGLAERPALAIIDLNMPKHSGMEVLEEMRANREFAELPVIVLSSSSSPRDRAQSAQFGVRRYIVKPPDLEEFMGIGRQVKELLSAGGTD